MELKPGYKQTDVGVIPEEWDVSSVGREYEIKLGKMLDAEKNVGVPKPYLGNRAVQWDRIDITDLPTVPMSRSDIERFRLRKGDLLVCEGGEVGRAAIWEAPIEECYYQKALHRLRPLRSFNSYVMAAFLRRWSDCGLLANYVTRTSIAHLPREKFMGVPMPVPPPPEQRAIAEALGDVDRLLGGLDRLIAKKRDLKQAAMQYLLTGRTRLPGFQGEWKRWTILQIAPNIIDYRGRTPLKLGMEWGGGDIPALSARNVKMGYIDFHEETHFGSDALYTRWMTNGHARKGDLVITTEAPLGNVALIPDDGKYILSQRTVLLQVDPSIASSKFLHHLMMGSRFQWVLAENASGSTATGIQRKRFEKLELTLPEVPEQTAIAEVLTDMDAEIEVLVQRRDKTRALKQGMMQELLTGRIRLV